MSTFVPPVALLIALVSAVACGSSPPPRALTGASTETTASPAPSSPTAAPPNAMSSPLTATPAPAPLSSSGSSEPAKTTAAASACDDAEVRKAIARELFADEDFHEYICEEPCTVDDFLAGLIFNQVVLRDAPRTLGCIALPLNQALTRIYGVFVLDENTPSLALIYMGLDLSVDPKFDKPGFKDLLGSERLDPGTWVTHRYVWSHRGYELKSTTKAVDTP